MTPAEALAMHTKYGAYVTFEENLKGTLAAGKFADLAVLSQNPLTVPTERIIDTKALMTMAGGQIVYQSKEF
jgi:predicted amidohydrolase YtcJ